MGGVIMSQKLKYNIPGYGYITADIYNNTTELFNILNYYSHDKRLRDSDQLGVMRRVYPGAHHTRYEYVFLQWALLSELVKVKKSAETNYGLNSGLKEISKMPMLSDKPTGGDILQSLILLANAGHLPETFTTSRALLQALKDCKELRKCFKQGLQKVDRIIFDQIMDEFNVYNVQYMVMLFLLNRYPKLKYEGETIIYPFEILRNYIISTNETTSDSKEGSLRKLWSIYRSIRRIAYLALDSHYTPVPFSIDITSIISNFNDSYTELFDMESKFQKALFQLNDVMRTNIYMSSEALLENSGTSELVYNKLLEVSKNNCNITWLKKVLSPSNSRQSDNNLQNIEDIVKWCYKVKDWNSSAIVHLEFRKSDLVKKETLDNLLAREIDEKKKIGKKKCKVAIHFDRAKDILNVIYALDERVKDKELLVKALQIMKLFISSKKTYLSNYGYESSPENVIQCMQLVLKGIFGSKGQFRFDCPGGSLNNYLYANYGSKKAANAIKQLISNIENTNYFDKDIENEINLTKLVLERLQVHGAIACFTGSTKLFLDPEQNTETAEFDGLIVAPSHDPYKMFAIIIEAKNHHKGHTAAVNQLKKRLSEHCEDYIDYRQIETVTNKGAYSVLKLKRES